MKEEDEFKIFGRGDRNVGITPSEMELDVETKLSMEKLNKDWGTKRSGITTGLFELAKEMDFLEPIHICSEKRGTCVMVTERNGRIQVDERTPP